MIILGLAIVIYVMENHSWERVAFDGASILWCIRCGTLQEAHEEVHVFRVYRNCREEKRYRRIGGKRWVKKEPKCVCRFGK